MTELDFDELDKAVNSLMADDSSAPVASASGTKPTDPPSVSTSPAVSVESTDKADSKPAAPSLATKRRGQFMDFVRPGASKPSAPVPHRPGVTITPSPSLSVASSATSDVNKPTEMSTPEPLEVVPSTVAPSEVEPATNSSDTSIKSDWPDPIDFASGETEKKDNATTQSASSDTPTVPDEAAPLESPFLPDAKPEKRPLGPVTIPESGAIETSSESTDTPSATPLPAELHGNVVAIESESTGQDKVSETKQAEPIESESAPDAFEPETKQAVQPVDTPAGGSIPQQYKEEPNTGDQTNGSIYDTANYHKAIEAHASGGKHTSVIKIAIWVVLLLVVGAGAGAALFMFTR